MSKNDEAGMEVESVVKRLQSEFDDAEEVHDSKPDQAIRIYDRILDTEDPKNELAKLKEEAIMNLGKLYAKLGRANDLRNLFVRSRPFFATQPKSKVGKIVRALIDVVGSLSNNIDDTSSSSSSSSSSSTPSSIASSSSSPSSLSAMLEVQAQCCREAIEWCTTSKRTLLKQRIESKLCGIYLLQRKFTEALSIISRLIRAVKKFDDKLLLVEIQLIESRIHLALQNVPKAKGALTAARSCANAIYCPPATAAEIDMQAGILCAAENDFRTGFSYFFESFEGYNTIKDSKNAIKALKYMLLSKIMMSQYEDVYSIINGKAGLKYSGIEMEALKAVADAYKERSVEQFEAVKDKYKAQLTIDTVIESHLASLRLQLLQQNLIRLVEPYSRVQLTHVAKLIRLPLDTVVATLSEMILDKKLNGILDQGSGDLLVFEQIKQDKTYTNAITTIKELNTVVDRLYQKAKQLAH